MPYDPNEPRDAEGKWTDAGNAIRTAASDDNKNNDLLKDDKGNPIILYHGTTKNFENFTLNDNEVGIHFGSKEQAEYRLKEKGNNGVLISVNLKIKNPIELSDQGYFDAENIVDDLKRIVHKDTNINYDDYKSVDELVKSNRYTQKDKNNAVKNLLIDSGYDGIKYKNTFESGEVRALKEKRKVLFAEAHKQSDKYGGYRQTPAWKDFEDLGHIIYNKSEYSYAVFNPNQIVIIKRMNK